MLKAVRNEITALEIDDEAPELDEAWNGVHDAIIALAKLEQKEKEARKVELINCCNYFHVTGQNRLIEALEDGKTICIYIDCVGHQRTEYERALYIRWLEEYYGERLECLKGKGIVGDDAFRLKSNE